VDSNISNCTKSSKKFLCKKILDNRRIHVRNLFDTRTEDTIIWIF